MLQYEVHILIIKIFYVFFQHILQRLHLKHISGQTSQLCISVAIGNSNHTMATQWLLCWTKHSSQDYVQILVLQLELMDHTGCWGREAMWYRRNYAGTTAPLCDKLKASVESKMEWFWRRKERIRKGAVRPSHRLPGVVSLLVLQ